MMSNLSLANIGKTYPNGHQAIHSLNLDVEPGELIVLVGPSGCGKSSLLRMIAGLETITDGELHIGEQQVNRLEPAQRDIAMVFQNYALYPHMSVFDNMAYGLRNRRTPKAQIRQQVESTAEMLQLEQLLERKPRQLSGGQRQRVAMGRAIVRQPKVFLFDEPLSNLDAKLRGQMRIEIKRLQRRLNTTTVYVTHDQTEAMTLADRLVVMNAGRAEQIGSPLDVYHRPQTPFVAGFIGSSSMNFITGRLDHHQLQLGEIRIPLKQKVDFNGEVIVGLRPEHLHRGTDYPHRIELDVSLLEQLGADTLVHGKVPGLDQELIVRLKGAAPCESGTRLSLGFHCDELHLFCANSQQRIN